MVRAVSNGSVAITVVTTGAVLGTLILAVLTVVVRMAFAYGSLSRDVKYLRDRGERADIDNAREHASMMTTMADDRRASSDRMTRLEMIVWGQHGADPGPGGD